MVTKIWSYSLLHNVLLVSCFHCYCYCVSKFSLLVKQYECLVEGCGLKLKSYKSRQQHLVDKHKFPTTFEFFKKAHLSKKQRLKHQRKKVSHKKEEAARMEIDETVNSLVSAVSKLSTSDSSPSSVSFGRRHTRALTFLPRAVQRDKKPGSTLEGRKG